MTLMVALRRGKWVRRKCWASRIDFKGIDWVRATAWDELEDKNGNKYPLDLNDVRALDWEVKGARKKSSDGSAK